MLQEKLRKTQTQINWIESHWKKYLNCDLNDTTECYNKTKRFYQLQLFAKQMERKITEIRKKSAINQKHRIQLQALQEDHNWINSQPGDRQLKKFQFNRLQKALSSLGYIGKSLTRLINEVISEIRFGSLCRQQNTSEALNIDYAINIAVKLVREQRWQCPTGLKKLLFSHGVS